MPSIRLAGFREGLAGDKSVTSVGARRFNSIYFAEKKKKA